jgi:hypothetical protein
VGLSKLRYKEFKLCFFSGANDQGLNYRVAPLKNSQIQCDKCTFVHICEINKLKPIL